MPIGLAVNSDIASNVEQAAYVCNAWGRCWWRPNYYYHPYAYYGPRYYRWGYRPYWGPRPYWGHRRW